MDHIVMVSHSLLLLLTARVFIMHAKRPELGVIIHFPAYNPFQYERRPIKTTRSVRYRYLGQIAIFLFLTNLYLGGLAFLGKASMFGLALIFIIYMMLFHQIRHIMDIRENGLVIGLAHIPWHTITSYEWLDYHHTFQLKLKRQAFLPISQTITSTIITAQEKDAIDSILQSYTHQ